MNLSDVTENKNKKDFPDAIPWICVVFRTWREGGLLSRTLGLLEKSIAIYKMAYRYLWVAGTQKIPFKSMIRAWIRYYLLKIIKS